MNWSTFAVLCCLSASIHWTIARSAIMRWFWNAQWLPHGIRALLECPACSGFWIGIGLGFVAGLQPLVLGHTILNVVAAGVLSQLGTPIVEAVLLWGLDRSSIH